MGDFFCAPPPGRSARTRPEYSGRRLPARSPVTSLRSALTPRRAMKRASYAEAWAIRVGARFSSRAGAAFCTSTTSSRASVPLRCQIRMPHDAAFQGPERRHARAEEERAGRERAPREELSAIEKPVQSAQSLRRQRLCRSRRSTTTARAPRQGRSRASSRPTRRHAHAAGAHCRWLEKQARLRARKLAAGHAIAGARERWQQLFPSAARSIGHGRAAKPQADLQPLPTCRGRLFNASPGPACTAEGALLPRARRSPAAWAL